MIWFTIALFVVSFLVTAFLTPKPKVENARPGGLDNLRQPQAAEGSPVPFILGKVRQRAPNTLWFGDFAFDPMTRKVKTGMFSSKRQTTGYKYYVSMDLGLCLGPGVKLHKIWFDKEEVWAAGTPLGGTSAEETDYVSAEGIYGGDSKGGGLGGLFKFYNGSFSQPANSWVADKTDGAQTPNYGGVAHIVFEDFYIGTTPQLRPPSFEVSRYPDPLSLGSSNIVGEDLNCASALYEIMTADWGGLAIAPTDIDDASFIAAAAVLASEQNGISLIISSPNSGQQACEEVLRQVDGILYVDPSTSKIVLRLIRADYDPGLIPVFDESNIAEIRRYTTSLWSGTYNQVRVNFPSREAKYENRTAGEQDMANIASQGRVKTLTISFPGCTNEPLAQRLARREMTHVSVPLIKISIETNREAATLRPGDVFQWGWAEYGIASTVMRVEKFNLGDLMDGHIVIDAIQDKYAANTIAFDPPEDSTYEPISFEATPISQAEILEAPYFVLANQIEIPAPAAGRAAPILHTRQPNSVQQGWRGVFSLDAFVTEFVGGDTDTVYTNTAVLEVGFSATAGQDWGYLNRIKVAAPRPLDFFAGASTAQMKTGVNLFFIGDELLSYQGVTNNLDGTYWLTGVRRALLDTAPAAHSLGDVLYFVSVDGLGELDVDDTDAVAARVWSSTARGESAVYALSRTMTGRQDRPLPPDLPKVASSRAPERVSTASTSVTVSWFERNRLGASALFQDDATESPEGGVTYNLSLYVDGVLNATQTGLTGTSYSWALPAASGVGRFDIQAVRSGVASRTVGSVTFTLGSATFTISEPRHFDTYSGLTAHGVWSVLRRRLSSWTGALVRIRDTNDDSEQDVGFDVNGYLNSYTVVGQARVVRIYSQKGDTNHLEQPTKALQPRLTTNAFGRPCVDFSSGCWLQSALTFDQFAGGNMVAGNLALLASGLRGTQTSEGYIAHVPTDPAAWSTPQTRWALCVGSTSTKMRLRGDTDDTAADIGDVTASQEFSVLADFGAAVAGQVTARLNSLVRQNTGVTFGGQILYPTTTRLIVGKSGGSDPYSGNLTELAVVTYGMNRDVHDAALMGELARAFQVSLQPHRYWRIMIDEVSGTASEARIAEVELHQTVGGANVATGGTALSSGAGGGTAAADAFDGNPATAWQASTSGAGSFLGYDLGSGNAKVIREIVVVADASLFANRSPLCMRVQSSDNNSDWSTEFYVNTTTWTASLSRTFTSRNL